MQKTVSVKASPKFWLTPKFWLAIVTGLTLIGVLLIVLLSPMQWIENRLDTQSLGNWFESRGILGVLAFVLGGALLTSIGLPRQIVALSAGYGFDVLAGTVLAIFSVSCGALLTFTFSRRFARPWVMGKFPDAINTMDRFIRDQPFLKIVTIRFAPIGTNMLTNLAAGATALSASIFFTASVAGFLPQTIVFVLAGNGLAVGSHQQLILATVLGAISILLGWLIYRRSRLQAGPE